MLYYKIVLATLLAVVTSDTAKPLHRTVHLTSLPSNFQRGDARFKSSRPVNLAQSGSADRKYVYIVSKLNGLVMDILNRDRYPGAHIIMWKKKPLAKSNQLWYQEDNGMIRSQMNGLCIDVGSDGYVIMNYCHEDAPMQKWVFAGEKIQNKNNGSIVLDISFYNRNRGARVASWTYHRGKNQHWHIEEESENDM